VRRGGHSRWRATPSPHAPAHTPPTRLATPRHAQVENLKAQVLSTRPAAGGERGRQLRSPRRTTRDASPRRERADSGDRPGSQQRLVRVNSTRDDSGGGGTLSLRRLARHSPSLSVPIMPDAASSDAIMPVDAVVASSPWQAPSNAKEAAEFMRAAAAAAKPPRPPRPMSPRTTSSRVPGHKRAASDVPVGVVGEL
jgi:hypothetical protein